MSVNSSAISIQAKQDELFEYFGIKFSAARSRSHRPLVSVVLDEYESDGIAVLMPFLRLFAPCFAEDRAFTGRELTSMIRENFLVEHKNLSDWPANVPQ